MQKGNLFSFHFRTKKSSAKPMLQNNQDLKIEIRNYFVPLQYVRVKFAQIRNTAKRNTRET